MNSRVLLLLLSAGSLHLACRSRSVEETLAHTPVRVEAVRAEVMRANEVFSYSGTLEESESTPLSFSVPGKVARVLVSEGDYVHKGQLLAELSGESYKDTYEMTRAALKQAEDAYNRLYPMYQNGNLPEVKLVEIQTGLQQAKSAAAIAQRNVTDCLLVAPSSGYVGKRSMEPGMSVIPGLAALTIVKIEKLFARIPVSESEIASIKKGQEARIRVGALGDREFTGNVEEIGVMADPIAHTYKVKIGVPNREKMIKPGMICNVTLETTAEDRGLILPTAAFRVDENGRTFIFAIDTAQNRAARKYVKTGRLLKNGIEITEGVRAGEWVVITGQQKLVDQSPVEMVQRQNREGHSYEQ
ncbi:MAG TPA: efflux RND transporter periplasmic adaptor subunit [bacterium]|nr:efflux RND transporter periplasmic adaptor subunit [bacterium]